MNNTTIWALGPGHGGGQWEWDLSSFLSNIFLLYLFSGSLTSVYKYAHLSYILLKLKDPLGTTYSFLFILWKTNIKNNSQKNLLIG